jgi:ADP-heptose:LPS heptosyltransferase
VKTLIVKLSSLGDLFHALPAVHNLKVGLGTRLDWAVAEEYAGLAGCFTDVDRVIAFPRRRFFAGFGSFAGELRRESYDRVIDLQGLLKSALVTCLARGKEKIGPSFHREGSRLFYSSVAGPRDRSRHAVEENLDVIGHLGIERLEPAFPVRFPAREPSLPAPRILQVAEQELAARVLP